MRVERKIGPEIEEARRSDSPEAKLLGWLDDSLLVGYKLETRWSSRVKMELEAVSTASETLRMAIMIENFKILTAMCFVM